jgi:transcriptional regulator with XRE-family HTH domain
VLDVRSLGVKVAELRAAHGWTLKHLSGISGVSLSHISAIENGTRPNPSIQQMMKLARAFGVSLSYFDDAAETETQTSRPSAIDHPEVQEIAQQFRAMYDSDTQKFIVSEQSKPYVSLARKLAEHSDGPDPSSLLQLIAQFMRDRQQPYHG